MAKPMRAGKIATPEASRHLCSSKRCNPECSTAHDVPAFVTGRLNVISWSRATVSDFIVFRPATSFSHATWSCHVTSFSRVIFFRHVTLSDDEPLPQAATAEISDFL